MNKDADAIPSGDDIGSLPDEVLDHASGGGAQYYSQALHNKKTSQKKVDMSGKDAEAALAEFEGRRSSLGGKSAPGNRDVMGGRGSGSGLFGDDGG